MPGPLPKDPAIRQRTNKAATAATLEPEPGKPRRVPKLPTILEEHAGQKTAHEWHPLTRAWWRDVWRSPMAKEFLQADVHGLYRLAVLVDRFWRTGSKDLAAEIRLQQQAYGLTPIDRRRLQWEVEQDHADQMRPRPAPQPQPEPSAAPIEDPRAVLRVLGGGK